MDLLKNYLLPPLAASLALLAAHLTLTEPLSSEVLVSLAVMFYIIGLFFVLTVWSMRWAFGLLKSSQATFVAAVLVASFCGLLLMIHPPNSFWAWIGWPLVLSCPLTALAMSQVRQA